MVSTEDVLVIETGDNPSASILWLHGLGADKHDFESIVPHLGIPQDLHVRFIFPDAPVRPITVNGGMPMRGWYDVRSMVINEQEDADSIRTSAQYISGLIEQQVKAGIPHARIIIAGFSQGGAIALFQGVRQVPRLGGIIALSSYLPLITTYASEANKDMQQMPVFIGHGTGDNIVPVELGAFTRDFLVENGLDVEYRLYPVAHSVSSEEISDLGNWITRILGR